MHAQGERVFFSTEAKLPGQEDEVVQKYRLQELAALKVKAPWKSNVVGMHACVHIKMLSGREPSKEAGSSIGACAMHP